jgi:hypothetical protein
MAVFPMPRGVFHAGQVQYGRKTEKGKCGIQSSLATRSYHQGSSRKPWPRADVLSLTASTLADATLLLATFCSSLMMAMLPFLM